MQLLVVGTKFPTEQVHKIGNALLEDIGYLTKDKKSHRH